MVGKLSVLFLSLWLFSSSGFCAEAHRGALPLKKLPQWLGLPRTLPFDYAEKNGFMPFEAIAVDENIHGPTTPFAESGVELPKGVVARDVFTDDHWVRLPRGGQITVSKDKEDRTVWNYPLHTELLHRIFLKETNKPIFEIRILKKISSKKWAFALFKRDPKQPNRLIRHECGHPKLEFSVETPSGRIPVRMERVDPRSCRECHSMEGHSHGGYQYPTEIEAGPCGFSPPNCSLVEKWAPEFQARHGYWPFIKPAGHHR